MLKRKQRLLIDQLDSKIEAFSVAKDVPPPSGGWIYAIRTALNMSLRQLASRLHLTPQAVKYMEEREQDGSITLKGLKEVANALNLKLVYALVPNDQTIENMIDKRARELAKQIVLRTSASMKLEDQENSDKRILKAIEERAEELKSENLKLLWE